MAGLQSQLAKAKTEGGGKLSVQTVGRFASRHVRCTFRSFDLYYIYDYSIYDAFLRGVWGGADASLKI